MTEIIGVRFKSVGKVYYFSPDGAQIPVGTKVIVETARGVECGSVVLANKMFEDSEIVPPLKTIIRIATEDDFKQIERNKIKEVDAADICERKIAHYGLKMNLVDVECTFDNSKLLFYFTAENRVDFRELVKDLASVFHTRIELRQIGVRDEAKMMGGFGVCGRQFCCASFLGEFQPVSIRMAKEQGLSLNPTKISGACGRLMCCLKYEQDGYEELLKITPKVGALVNTPSGKGTVTDANLISGKITVKLDGAEDTTVFERDKLTVIKDAVIKVSREELKALKDLEK
ncbi:MAG: stage 0 sporulation family protein [Oscillospiraceae bacterium]|nr:stage 0 sporulation family protein [Oscillospiraceae bacterium]